MTIKRGYVDIGAGQVHYRRGGGQGKRPVVFLHQTASSGEMWERVFAALPAERPLIALDTPGFGGSFDPAAPAKMPDYVGWIADSIAALGIERPHLAGHHTGASIAMAMVHRDPDCAASLAMIGPDYIPVDERAAASGRFGVPFRPGRSGAYLLKNWEYLRVGGADQETLLLHREMIGMLRAYASRPDAYRAVWDTDFVAAFDAARLPMLIMAARDDALFSGFERARAARPGVRAVELNGGANFEPDLVPQEVAGALHAFWAEVD